jgi:hypothetical protein
MDLKEQTFEIYKILISQNSHFVDNQQYCKELARLSMNIINTFETVYNDVTVKEKELTILK